MEDNCKDAQKLYESGYNLYQKGIIEGIDKYLEILKDIALEISKNWLNNVAVHQVDNITLVYNKLKNFRNKLCAYSILSMMLSEKKLKEKDANIELNIPIYNEINMLIVSCKKSDELVINNEIIKTKEKLEVICNNFEKIFDNSKKYYKKILNNWQIDSKKDDLVKIINKYYDHINDYKVILDSVLNITTKYVEKFIEKQEVR